MRPIVSIFLALFTLNSLGQDKPKPSPWEGEVSKYEAAEKAKPAPTEAVVFNGSSSIRMWKLNDSFPGWKVTNHGIGGSTIPENTALVDRLIFPLKPKAIVFYAGDNDMAKGRKPQEIADDWAAYVTAVRAKLPKVKIVFIAIKPSIARWKLWPVGKETNEKIKAWCDKAEDVKFIDVAPVMLGSDGLPIKELFKEDGLHMVAAGYERWTKLVAPEIEAFAK